MAMMQSQRDTSFGEAMTDTLRLVGVFFMVVFFLIVWGFSSVWYLNKVGWPFHPTTQAPVSDVQECS